MGELNDHHVVRNDMGGDLYQHIPLNIYICFS